MGFYAEPWLREARDSINSLSNEPATAISGQAEFDKLAEAVNKAIKAALIENHGSLPEQLDHGKLVAICEATGVWDILPPALKCLVQEVEAYRSMPAAASSEPASGESSAQQLQRYFFVARRLIDYMEFHVIGNDSVLKRLKVA